MLFRGGKDKQVRCPARAHLLLVKNTERSDFVKIHVKRYQKYPKYKQIENRSQSIEIISLQVIMAKGSHWKPEEASGRILGARGINRGHNKFAHPL